MHGSSSRRFGWYDVAPLRLPSRSEHRMHSARRRFLVLLVGLATALTLASPAQTAVPSQPEITLEAVTSSRPLRDGIEIHAGAATLWITALRDDILRVRITPDGVMPEDASWAVLAGPRGKSVAVQP